MDTYLKVMVTIITVCVVIVTLIIVVEMLASLGPVSYTHLTLPTKA